MRFFSKFFCLLFCLSMCPLVSADTPSEIQYLLHFIGQTDCVFIRNGDNHNAKEALEHIQKKHKHFKKKIRTAEDFIKYSATGSLISKKPYHVDCPQKNRQPSAQWLLIELAQFRKNQDTTDPESY